MIWHIFQATLHSPPFTGNKAICPLSRREPILTESVLGVYMIESDGALLVVCADCCVLLRDLLQYFNKFLGIVFGYNTGAKLNYQSKQLRFEAPSQRCRLLRFHLINDDGRDLIKKPIGMLAAVACPLSPTRQPHP